MEAERKEGGNFVEKCLAVVSALGLAFKSIVGRGLAVVSATWVRFSFAMF